MTKEDTEVFESMKKNYNNLQSNGSSPIDDLCIPHSSSDTTTISDITKDPNHHYGQIILLNYLSGNSAMVLETLVGAQDLNEGREKQKE